MNQTGENLILQTVLRAILVAANQNSWRALDATLVNARAQLAQIEAERKQRPRLTALVARAS
jgi:hypothetical protein